MPHSLTSSILQLRVAVLLDDEHVIVRGDELGDRVGERKRAHAHLVEVDALPSRARRATRPSPRRSSRTRSTPARVGCAARSITGAGTQRLRGLELAQQPLHVVDVRRPLLGVARVAVLGRAAREVAAARRMRARDTCDTECRRRRRRDSGRTPCRRRAPPRSSPCRGRAARLSSQANGSVSQSCMPMSRSSITKIGVCSRSARSNACAPISKHSVGSSGNSSTCLVSPCDAYAQNRRSACCVRVGMPVDGLPRCTSNSTPGISAKYASPRNSCISEMPGPDVAVNARAPFHARADHHADRRELVLGLHDRVAVLAGRRVGAELAAVLRERLGERRRRRDRIPRADGRAAVHGAQRRRAVAVDEDAVADVVARARP